MAKNPGIDNTKFRYLMVKKVAGIRVRVATPLWSCYISKKAEKQFEEHMKQDESRGLHMKHEYYQESNRTTGGSKSEKLKEFLMIFEAQKILAKNDIKLSPQQYDCFKSLIQAFAKGILGFELITHEAYLSRKYGLVDHWDVLAFMMGRRFGKTYLQMYTQSIMMSTQRDWQVNVFNVSGKVGHEVLKGTELFIEKILKDGTINCKILESNDQFLVVKGHYGTENTMFSSPNILKGGSVSEITLFNNIFLLRYVRRERAYTLLQKIQSSSSTLLFISEPYQVFQTQVLLFRSA